MCDIKKLIAEVKVRPEIWDNTLKLDRATRNKAWKDLCYKCIPKFGTKSIREKKYLVSQFKNKWNGLRDNFKREYWRIGLRELQNDSESTPSRQPFRYYHNLTFLLKLIEQPVTENPATQEDESSEPPALDSHRAKRRKTSSNMETPEPEQETMSLQSFPSRLSENEVDEADRNFLFSLLPHLTRVPNEYKLDARMDIMRVLKKFKSQQQQQVQHFFQPVGHSTIRESSHSVSCNEQVPSVDSSNENRYR